MRHFEDDAYDLTREAVNVVYLRPKRERVDTTTVPSLWLLAPNW